MSLGEEEDGSHLRQGIGRGLGAAGRETQLLFSLPALKCRAIDEAEEQPNDGDDEPARRSPG